MRLHSIESHSKQVEMLLQYIIGPVDGGNIQVFYDFLDVMQHYGISSTKKVAMEMKSDLNKVSLLGVGVLVYTCDSLSENYPCF